MNASEHIAQALIHLDAAANANYDHLLREQRHTEWNREVLASARASCAEIHPYRSHAVWAAPTESWVVPDLRHLRDDGESSYWTDDPEKCQVYYDLENAFRCAGILASITDQDIEVVELD